MSRKGCKNKRTLQREANIAAARAKSGRPVRVDSLDFMEAGLKWFHDEIEKRLKIKKREADDDAEIKVLYGQGLEIAKAIVGFRYPRLSATKVSGDPKNPLQIDSTATKEQLMAEIRAEAVELGIFPDAPRGVANRVQVPNGANGKTVN